jgi:hypothetical protein
MPLFLLLFASALLSACQETRVSQLPPGEVEHPRETAVIRRVFVVSMENTDAAAIYGGADRAPYLNDTLLVKYAHAVNFIDPLPTGIPSEPHYIWMEAGTNALPDHVFQDNSDALAGNSTSSGAHLTAQIRRAANDDWMSYQEGIDSLTGACPVASSGLYAAKHNPFVFFRDVSGNPPSKTNAYCASHHRPLSALADDLAAGTVATYTFITPDLCHDMHGDGACPEPDPLRAGDDWLRANLPPLIAFAEAHDGVVFIVWDEGEGDTRIPFIAIGPGVKKGYAGKKAYNHGSLVKSVERILGLPYLATVANGNDFADLFEPGKFP